MQICETWVSSKLQVKCNRKQVEKRPNLDLAFLRIVSAPLVKFRCHWRVNPTLLQRSFFVFVNLCEQSYWWLVSKGESPLEYWGKFRDQMYFTNQWWFLGLTGIHLLLYISPFAFSPSVGELEGSSHFSLSLSTFVAKHQFIQEAVLTLQRPRTRPSKRFFFQFNFIVVLDWILFLMDPTSSIYQFI